MSEFVNTLDVLGDETCLKMLIEQKGLTEFYDNRISSLRSNAFRNQAELIKISLPNLKYVNSKCFNGCNSLEVLDLPNLSNTGLEVEGFYNLTSLKTLNANIQPKTIPNYCFYGCSNLEGFFDLDFFANVTAIGEFALNGCKLPNTLDLSKVTTLKNSALRRTTLKEVILPSNMTIIPEYVFMDSLLETIDLSKITEIGQHSFYNTKLTSVNAPLVTTMGDSAFSSCSNLLEASFPSATSVERLSFANCTNLTSINLPKVTKIGYNTFKECTNLVSLSLPSVTDTNYNAFENSGVKELQLQSLTEVPTGAFDLASNLEKIILDSVVTFKGACIEDCKKLKKLILKSQNIVTLSAKLHDFYSYSRVDSIIIGTGYIYVPKALIEEYKVATNWSNYAHKFREIEGGIESGSHVEFLGKNSNKIIKLPLWNNFITNTTPNVTITSSNNSIASLEFIEEEDEIHGLFKLTSYNEVGECSIDIETSDTENSSGKYTVSVKVIETYQEPHYEFEKGRGFYEDISGEWNYYSFSGGSTKGRDWIKIKFNKKDYHSKLIIDYIFSNGDDAKAYNNVDILNIDQFMESSQLPSEYIYTNLGYQEASNQTKSLVIDLENVEEGEHFIQIRPNQVGNYRGFLYINKNIRFE